MIILMEGTSGSVNVQIFNDNLKELQVLESKRNTIRKGLVHELPNAQDTVLCSYVTQRSGERSDVKPYEVQRTKYSKGWTILSEACTGETRRRTSEGLVGGAFGEGIDIGTLARRLTLVVWRGG